MNEIEKFNKEVEQNIESISKDKELQDVSNVWLQDITKHKYAYNFSWLGRPIIQLPQDIIAMQEIIWDVKPTVIIETGIAHGGSLIFYASMLELLGNHGKVIGIDIDIRIHNRIEIEKHPMFKRITLVEGSSIDIELVNELKEHISEDDKVLVVLDSNHTHEHVLRELELYSNFVRKDSYIVVFDTLVEDLPDQMFEDRPWGKGNNPKTAVHEFLKTNSRFSIDKSIQYKLLMTVAPDGYLRCLED